MMEGPVLWDWWSSVVNGENQQLRELLNKILDIAPR